MRKLAVILLSAAAASLLLGPGAGAQRLQSNCVLPSATPNWIDFADGSVPFWQMFAKPGVIAAASNLIYPPKLRAGGAQTVYFDLYLKNRVGVPSAPLDPATIVARADKFYDYAAQSMDCSNPVIAENELFGAGLPTPWSETTAQYRANVLTFLRRLRERGAQPWLLVNSTPATAGDAADWWRQVTGVAGIVREIYFPAPLIYKQGPLLGSRTLRQSFRAGMHDFTQVGVPTSKLAIFVGFQTTPGWGGRERLRPARAWFETVKLQALAARQVGREMKLNAIWSWGWAQWDTLKGEIDTDKPRAACVYLWTRDAKLCNGPAAAGKGFDRSLKEGQLSLPGGVRCRFGGLGVTWSSIKPLLGLTGDPEIAFSNAFARAIEARTVRVGPAEIAAAEGSIVAARFGGSRGAYTAALTEAHTSLGVARGVIADELRHAKIEARLGASVPSAPQILDYRATYSDVPVRLVQTGSAPSWLGGRRVGYALASTAPGRLMALPSGRWSSVWSPLGTVKVRPLGAPAPLGSVPLARIRPSIRAALIAQSRDTRFPAWIAGQQVADLDQALCWRDEFPAQGEVDLTDYLPFLALTS